MCDKTLNLKDNAKEIDQVQEEKVSGGNNNSLRCSRCGTKGGILFGDTNGKYYCDKCYEIIKGL